jgi:acetate kinase
MAAYASCRVAPEATNIQKKTSSGVEALISTADSSVKVCVIPTNEELAICRETVKLVG